MRDGRRAGVFRLDDLRKVTVGGFGQHLLNLSLVSMAQTLVPEEEFLLGDGEVLVCLISHAHTGVHLVGVGELLGIGIEETNEVSAAFEVLRRQHKGQGAASIVREIEGCPVFQGKVSAFVIHFEESGPSVDVTGMV